MKKVKTGFMLIELLVALAIIMFIASKVFKPYFIKPSLDKETQKVMSEQGVNSTNYQSLIDSTKKKLQDIQDKRMKESGKILEE